jgi:hypothetical protein
MCGMPNIQLRNAIPACFWLPRPIPLYRVARPRKRDHDVRRTLVLA